MFTGLSYAKLSALFLNVVFLCYMNATCDIIGVENLPDVLTCQRKERKKLDTENKRKEKDVSIVLEQWKTCVEMANTVSQRRDAMNNIFITLTASIFTARIAAKNNLISVVGISVCVIWEILISNFKALNAAKFDVINRMERMLPCSPFNDEWEKLNENNKYHDGTRIESLLPYIMILAFVVAIFIK